MLTTVLFVQASGCSWEKADGLFGVTVPLPTAGSRPGPSRPGPTVLGDAIIATDGHPFWVPLLGEWVDAVDLVPGMWFLSSEGTLVQVTSTRVWTEPERVHNLTVRDLHTYYVVTTGTSVLVHNCSTGGLSLSGARHVSGRFPKVANPRETLFRQKEDGEVTAYARYDAEGEISQRADLDPNSAPHAGIPAPHILDMARHVNPKTGQVFRNWEKMPRPLRPEEELCGCR